ncbi:hypothetical protein HMPREF0005_03217 [Achromobacter xylosoxidans C54]|uniref:ABC transporter substrate-binding protein n=2 Tax=Burkholderiales TaxID=80840 RepID=UPI0001F43D47|nr:ABC transporter substrate binding protein [Achromobacter xylosoxidans]EFV87696.1 hypothetical protein HMPREF0005_03217 [Achromobacter xylosoxidans C54]CUR74191.1 ABC-type uncharacterized transport system, periplasmic component [Achromobacter xylosoxidans]
MNPIAPLIFAVLLLTAPAAAQDKPGLPSTPAQAPGVQSADALQPRAGPGGRRWRIGYVQSGEYQEYPRTLAALVQGLRQLGWLSIGEIPAGLDGRQTWNYIAEHARSDTLSFVRDAWWQPGDFDASARPAMRLAIMDRLTRTADVDLMIAMGTWAGQDMAAIGPPVPTVVGSASDPVSAGIVASAADSGRENLHARVEPERYEQQIRLFNSIVPFKTLGVVYEDTAEGRGYAALDALQRVASERGFRLVHCQTRTSGIDAQQAQLNVLTCYKRLAATVEAMYVTVSSGLTADITRRLAALLRARRIPSFAMLGAEEVQNGLLLSMARADYAAAGRYHADVIARILRGQAPRHISQLWREPARIALNFETMRIIGFDPPMELLLAADDIFELASEPKLSQSVTFIQH